MRKRFYALIWSLLALVCMILGSGAVNHSRAQSLGPYDRDNAQAMLSMIKDDLKSNYYDQTFHGLDLEGRFKEASVKVKQATTRDQLMAIVAG